ncbi:MAG: lamin tail domain-containing protein [Chloroflexota bacterium]|nr:lamin tail domain-containing protein [Chloroflexota bacterium]
MSKQHLAGTLTILLLVLVACMPEVTSTPPEVPPTPTETPLAVTTPLVISEAQTSATGNNNLEFIEIYNATTAPLDLAGYQLVYRLASSQENILVHTWTERALVPAHGHYLLVRTGQEEALGAIADAMFDQPLNTNGGGLALLNPQGEVVDSVGWGNAPEALVEGGAAPVPENDTSIERLPGGEEGNFTDTGDNGADFVVNTEPDPQNTGSLPTPVEEDRFFITLTAPSTVEPGARFDYELEATNNTGVTTHDVEIVFTVPPSLTVVIASDDGEVSLPPETGERVQWTLAEMADGDTVSRRVTVEAPQTYATLMARDYSVQASDWPQPALGAPVRTHVEGGIIPIAAARSLSLIGKLVTVEGVTTMYTGGYYAGTNNAKFYIQDESGGIQIQCFDDSGTPPVVVLGERVRVTGEVGVYRNSMQIVPTSNLDDVVILGQEETIPPQEVTVAQAAGNPAVSGRLIVATGQAIRVEEFTYSYEIDLADDQGHIALVYVDKLTGMGLEIEQVEIGHQYTIAGISEMYDDIFQLKPRIPSDIVEVFAPVLAVEANAPHNVLPGETFDYTITVLNHTDVPFTGVVITSTLPAQNGVLAAIKDGGELEDTTLRWAIPTLPAHESQSVHFSVVATSDAGTISIERYAAWANEWPLHETALPLLTFIGESVPIYAIQGPGFVSPYKLSFVDTEGVVTGIFPELEGFWIQGVEPDDDPITSEGLFVFTGENPIEIQEGDRVEVHGRVRERSNQTELHITAPEDVVVADSGLPLPEPAELNPPVETEAALAYYEPLEGMLVGVTDPAFAVAPTSKYGEYVIVRAEHGIERVLRGQETGLFIMVDDGAATRHDDSTTLSYTVRTGDRVGNLVGPLAFTFDNYKIEPVEPPEVVSLMDDLIPQLPDPDPDEFSVATFNVENFFDDQEPHLPSDPAMPSQGEYERKRDQIVETIVSLGVPTVVGLQEVENVDVLEDVAAQPALAEYGYQAALIEGPSSRDIDVGFLVRSDRATLEGVGQYQAPEGLFSRPPLMITMTVHTASAGDVTIHAIVNHFISKSGGEALTEPRRVKEAEWNAYLVDQILIADPDAYVVVLGDLNDYYDSAPLRALTEGSIPGGRLVNVADMLLPEERYSYIFQGVSQLLDHILATPALATRQVRVDVLHINADYPPSDPADLSPRHCSDHDPIVATFRVER